MPIHHRFDALVIGARCAGAATAMLMARRGLRVLAIDRGGYGADTLSTHALMRGAVLQLHRWGVLPRIVRMGTPAARSTTFHYGAEAVQVPIKPSHGVDALYSPRRTVLDRVLVDAAREAGADVRHGWTLVDVIRNLGGRIVGAVLLDEDGRRTDVAADLLIGADGIGSTVARLVEAPVEREARHAAAALYGYWSGIAMDGNHWHYTTTAGAGRIPTNGGQHCVFVGMSERRFRDEARHDPSGSFHNLMREAAPELADQLPTERLEGKIRLFAGRKGFLRRAHGPGWALVGDAGYFKDPITAHGITDALRDAELLAAAAARGTDAALRDYAATRDALSLPLFEVTDAIAAFDWDLDRLKELHLALNKAMKRETDHMASPMAERLEAMS